MTTIKTYKDSKEFPLENYERIDTTGDFFYMIKGYESGDETEADITEMEQLYKDVIQEFVISINAKDFDIVNNSEMVKFNNEIICLVSICNIITLKIRSNKIRESLGIEINNSDVKSIVSGLKIQKSDDLEKQLEIIKNRIKRIENDISETDAKIKRKPEEKEKSDVNRIITNVEMILERTIDLKKTSLYRFGIMQEQAGEKVKKMNQINSK